MKLSPKDGTILARIQQWDTRLLLRFNGTPDSPWTSVYRAFSFLGRETIWLGLIACFLFVYYNVELFVHFGSDLLYGILIAFSIKIIIRRPRPSVIITEVRVLDGPNRSYSFPSWHSYNLVAFSLSFAYFTNSPLILVFGLVTSAIVAYSRIYLGVHYPSDVIVGYLCGVPGFLLARATTPWWEAFVHFMETFVIFPTVEGWNYFLREIWYGVIVAGIYFTIILTGWIRVRQYKKCGALAVKAEVCYEGKDKK